MTGTYIDIIKKQGLVSKIKLDKFKNQIYRSSMPMGCYDKNNEIIRIWETINPDYVICFCPKDEFIRKANKKQFQIYGNKFEFINYPINNYEIPNNFNQLIKLLDIIKEKLNKNKKIILHCSAGIGRTGLILGCLLVYLGYTKTDSFKFLRDNIFNSLHNKKQLDFFNLFIKKFK